MPYRIIDSNIKEKYTNEELMCFYNKKNNIMNSYFPHSELSTSQFVEEVFLEALNHNLLVSDYDYESHGANGKLYMYSPSLSRSIYLHSDKSKYIKANTKLMLTKDNIYDLNIEGYNGVLFSTNLYYGLGGKDNLAYLCNLDIDLDEIYTDSDLIKLISLIENKKILKPTIITSSGTGLHLIYRLSFPIDVYYKDELKDNLRKLKTALCKTIEINYKFDKVYKGRIKPLALDQMTRCVGSTTKIGEGSSCMTEALENTCKAWLVGKSYDFKEIFDYVQENLECNLEDFNTKCKSSFEKTPEIQKFFKCGNKSYIFATKKLYYSWLKRAMQVKKGSRYYAMLGVASYGIKCNIKKSQIEKDLKMLQEHYNSLSTELITDDDVMSALKGYSQEHKYSKGETIAKRCGLTVNHSKRNFKSRKEHLNSIKKLSGRKSKKEELSTFLTTLVSEGKDVSKMSVRKISSMSGISKTTVAKYFKTLLKKLLSKTQNTINAYRTTVKRVLAYKKLSKTPVDFFFDESVRFSLLLYKGYLYPPWCTKSLSMYNKHT